MQNYYKVVARVGHFKRGFYALKSFYVVAENGKHAAERVRYIPRVKHDDKHAIESVEAITYEEYEKGKAINSADAYFNVHNKQQQIASGVEETLYMCKDYNCTSKSYLKKGDGTRGKMSSYNKKRYTNRYLPCAFDEYEEAFGISC